MQIFPKTVTQIYKKMVSLLIYRETFDLHALIAKIILQSYDHVVKKMFMFLCVAHIHVGKGITSSSVYHFCLPQEDFQGSEKP